MELTNSTIKDMPSLGLATVGFHCGQAICRRNTNLLVSDINPSRVIN